jgi:hypothetical protein
MCHEGLIQRSAANCFGCQAQVNTRQFIAFHIAKAEKFVLPRHQMRADFFGKLVLTIVACQQFRACFLG